MSEGVNEGYDGELLKDREDEEGGVGSRVRGRVTKVGGRPLASADRISNHR